MHRSNAYNLHIRLSRLARNKGTKAEFNTEISAEIPPIRLKEVNLDCLLGHYRNRDPFRSIVHAPRPHLDCLKFVLTEFGRTFVENWHSRDTPLVLSIRRYNLPAVHMLLDAFVNPDEVSYTESHGYETPLIAALRVGHGGAIDALLAAGARVGRFCRDRHTPLHLALAGPRYFGIHKQHHWGEIFLEHYIAEGGDIDDPITDDDRPSLCVAAQAQNWPMVQVCLAHGAKVNRPVLHDFDILGIVIEYADYALMPPYKPLDDEKVKESNLYQIVDALLSHGAHLYARAEDKSLARFLLLQCQMYRLLYIAGYDLSKVLVITGQNQLTRTLELQELWPNGEHDFHSLKGRTRTAIRNCMQRYPRENLFEAVTKLGLPKPLQRYLVFNETLQNGPY